MELKKLFFPIGAGEELRERIRGALLVNKFFGTHLSILACQLDPATVYNVRMTLRGGILFDEFLRTAEEELKEEQQNNLRIVREECEKLGIIVSEDQSVPNSAFLRNLIGNRSDLVQKHSRYSDMVIAAVPTTGKITGTFEATVVKSGRPAIVIPRVLEEFKAEKILVALTGSAESSRALGHSLDLLKKAKKVHCITARHYLQESEDETIGRIDNYLDLHGIKATFDTVDAKGKVPGQILLENAENGNFDLIVAGMSDDNGIREVFLSGTAHYFLQNTKIPVMM